MLFKRISRDDAETAFIVVKNASGSTMTAGYHAFFDVSTAADGVQVTIAQAFALNAYAGCIDKTLLNGAYGLAQVYGYRAEGYVVASRVIASGMQLMPVDGEWALDVVATAVTSGYKAWGFICEAIASATESTHSNKRIFIRAL